ncbi:Krueppel-like factor 11 [Lachnellula arida]|uniref:Krueppel-like factor 11 n=1 Tax=Lachnellula arida TaxID=1316785 RepID=A0A8T9B3C4_9HELO|nr:Krueppel-like factor 11 [Lachnellula arida]
MGHTEPTKNSRWACKFSGCEKSFARKEHLTRHERTHSRGDHQYECKVCLQKFNRGDSLQRHLARHGDDYKPSPSGRVKRACITCHKGKSKCDGDQPCSRCHSKGAVCRYEQVEQQNRTPPPPNPPLDVVESGGIRRIPGPEAQLPPSLHVMPMFPVSTPGSHHLEVGSGGPWDGPAIPNAQPSITPPPRNVTPTSKAGIGNGIVGLKTMQLRKDSSPRCSKLPVDARSEFLDEALPMAPDDATDSYEKLYFDHFHHRWPIIHRPPYEGYNPKHVLSVLRLSTLMIGGWFSRTVEGKKYALAVHDYLMLKILTKLGGKNSNCIFQQDTLPSWLCQAALINIVFALHTGIEQNISRSAVLRSTLVSVLQEVGFFRSETVWLDEKPGYFIPLHLSLLGERQRLAAYLFKIDNYVSIIRAKPALLTTDDLHFTIQSTYATWNAKGLDIFATRIEEEPTFRNQISMSDWIKDLHNWKIESKDRPLLIEDITLFMCSMEPKIAEFWDKMRNCSFVYSVEGFKANCPRHRLDALKLLLDRISCQLTRPTSLECEILPLRHYYGYEDPTEPGWQDAARARVKGLLFDAKMLYHCLNIQLNADIRMLAQLAKDGTATTNTQRHLPESDPEQQERESRAKLVKPWTTTSLARRSLLHAAEVLVLHEQNKEFDTRTMDPIAFVALAAGALAIWAYCMFSGDVDAGPAGGRSMEGRRGLGLGWGYRWILGA